MSLPNLLWVEQMCAVMEEKVVAVKAEIQEVPSGHIRSMVQDMQNLLGAHELEFNKLKDSITKMYPPSEERDQLLEGFSVVEKMIDLGYTIVNLGLTELNRRGEQL
jgi:hypothetical protein